MNSTPEWIVILAPFLSGAAGIGMAWGIIRQRVIESERRISRVEDELEEQVGEERCYRMRDECKDAVANELGRLREEVSKNRDTVSNKLESITRFMGAHNGK